MKKIALFLLLFTAQFSFGQYSGEANIIFANSQTDIVKHADKSADLSFTVEGIDAAQLSALQQDLESKPELSNVIIDNGVWSLHVASGTPKKVVMSHFMNNGFKFITVDGETKDILAYLSGN